MISNPFLVKHMVGMASAPGMILPIEVSDCV